MLNLIDCAFGVDIVLGNFNRWMRFSFVLKPPSPVLTKFI